MVDICRNAANGVIDRVVSEAARAAHTFGLGGDAASRYGDNIRASLPLAFDAMALPDGPERDAKIEALAAHVRGISDENQIPRLVERGLVAIAVRLAREVVRRRAADRGFTPDELEREFVAFADQLEGQLFEP
jgi:hypothetical protein